MQQDLSLSDKKRREIICYQSQVGTEDPSLNPPVATLLWRVASCGDKCRCATSHHHDVFMLEELEGVYLTRKLEKNEERVDGQTLRGTTMMMWLNEIIFPSLARDSLPVG
jgi:hypothetical protein